MRNLTHSRVLFQEILCTGSDDIVRRFFDNLSWKDVHVTMKRFHNSNPKLESRLEKIPKETLVLTLLDLNFKQIEVVIRLRTLSGKIISVNSTIYANVEKIKHKLCIQEDLKPWQTIEIVSLNGERLCSTDF